MKNCSIYLLLFFGFVLNSFADCHKDIEKEGLKKTKNEFASHFSFYKSSSASVLEIIDDKSRSYFFSRGTFNSKCQHRRIDDQVTKIASESTSHLTYIEMLGKLEYVRGFSNKNYIAKSKSYESLFSSNVIELGMPIKQELLINSQAQLLLKFTAGGERYDELNITVIPIFEYFESEPLGRTEWIKVFGYLIGEDRKANEKFLAIKKNFEKLISQKPIAIRSQTFLIGSIQNGSWEAPSHESGLVKLMQLVGMTYVFNENVKNRIIMPVESVLTLWPQVEIWLPLTLEENYEQLVKRSAFYEAFKIKDKKVVFIKKSKADEFWQEAFIKVDKLFEELIEVGFPQDPKKLNWFKVHEQS